MANINLNDLLDNSNLKHKSNLLATFENITESNILEKIYPLDDDLSHKIKQLSESEKAELKKESYLSNADKALTILNATKDEFCSGIRNSAGDIRKVPYYESYMSMKKELELAYKYNAHLNKINEILQHLENDKHIYISAFQNNQKINMLKYYCALSSALMAIVYEYANSVDLTASKNESKVVLSKDLHFMDSKDVSTILDTSIKVLNTKNIFSAGNRPGHVGHIRGNESKNVKLSEGFFNFDTSSIASSAGETIGQGLATGAVSAAGGIFSSMWSSPTAVAIGHAAGVASIWVGTAFLALFILMAIRRMSARFIIEYVKSYAHIHDAAKHSNLRSDRVICKILDGMNSLKRHLQGIFKNEKSRNASDYIKELNRDSQNAKQVKFGTSHKAPVDDSDEGDFF